MSRRDDDADHRSHGERPSSGFERNVQGLLVVAVVVAALVLFVDWSNVWRLVRPILDYFLR